HSIIEGSITCLHTFFFNDTAPTAIYTLSYTTLFRSEALAHRGEDLFGEGVLLARAEAHVQRRTEHVRRNGFLDCGEQRPATFAGILHVARVVAQVLVAGERHRGEIEEPRRHHTAAPPYLGNVGEVEIHAMLRRQLVAARMPQDVEAFGVRLHEAVLDAVVHHLHEMAGPVGTGMQVTLLDARIARLTLRR